MKVRLCPTNPTKRLIYTTWNIPVSVRVPYSVQDSNTELWSMHEIDKQSVGVHGLLLYYEQLYVARII